MSIKKILSFCFTFLVSFTGYTQVNSNTSITAVKQVDTLLRIKNLNPYFTIHVDSTLKYQLEINKNPSDYYWFLKNSPVGLKITKDNGSLTFKAEKSYFLSGRLKYDYEYRVNLTV